MFKIFSSFNRKLSISACPLLPLSVGMSPMLGTLPPAVPIPSPSWPVARDAGDVVQLPYPMVRAEPPCRGGSLSPLPFPRALKGRRVPGEARFVGCASRQSVGRAGFLLRLMLSWIFPCKIPLALCHVRCCGVLIRDRRPARALRSPLEGGCVPPSRKRMGLGSPLLLPLRGSCFGGGVKEEPPGAAGTRAKS